MNTLDNHAPCGYHALGTGSCSRKRTTSWRMPGSLSMGRFNSGILILAAAAIQAKDDLRCHSPAIYQRPQHLIQNLNDLRQQVDHCELGQELH